MAKRPRKVSQQTETVIHPQPAPLGTTGLFRLPEFTRILEPNFRFLPGHQYLIAYNGDRHTLAEITQWLYRSVEWLNGEPTIHYYNHNTPQNMVMAHRLDAQHRRIPTIGIIGLPHMALETSPVYVPFGMLADSVFIVESTRFTVTKHCQYTNLTPDRVQLVGRIL